MTFRFFILDVRSFSLTSRGGHAKACFDNCRPPIEKLCHGSRVIPDVEYIISFSWRHENDKKAPEPEGHLRTNLNLIGTLTRVKRQRRSGLRYKALLRKLCQLSYMAWSHNWSRTNDKPIFAVNAFTMRIIP